MRNLVLPALLLPALLGGCTLLRPKLDMQALTPTTASPTVAGAELPFISPTQVGSWVVVEPAAWASATVPDVLNFTGQFEGLAALQTRMMAQNPTLQQAQGRLQQAQAVAGASLAALLPSLNGSASMIRERNSPASTNQGGTNLPTRNRTSLSATASWPLDIFGRFTGQLSAAKRLRDSADAQVQATALNLKAAVAQTYVQLLAAHQNTATWQTLMVAAEEQNRLTQLRYTAGDIPLTSAEPVFATLQGLRVQALSAAQTEQQLHHTLAALLGEAPQTFTLPEADLARLNTYTMALPQQASATLLLQRADVRAAAAQLAASNANIGAARAAFLPNISLNGNAGFVAGEGVSLLDWNNRSWSVGPVLSLPIFQGGAVRANLKRAWGQYEEAVGVYRAQVLTAYKEAANAFTAVQVAQHQAQSTQAAAEALGKAASAMQLRYQTGDVAKTEALSVQVQALQARIMAASAAAATHAAVAELARSLGGGW